MRLKMPIFGACAVLLCAVIACETKRSPDTDAAATVQGDGRGTPPVPALTGAVNDFAQVIPPEHAREIESAIRSLRADTGDVIVVATVQTMRPYEDIRDYALVMFENRGQGIGEAGKNNGVLIVAARDERQIRITTGYGMEAIVTDALAEQTIAMMVPLLRQEDYGGALRLGVSATAAHIRAARGRP